MPTHPRAVRVRGFTLVEMLVAVTIGVILIGAVISVYLAQSQVYKGGTSQASIQNAENAISALVAPTVRAAGFSGCGTVASALSNLVAGGPPPLGTLATAPAMVAGYEANGTSGASSNVVMSVANPPDDYSASDWTPALVPSLLGSGAIPVNGVNAGVVADSDVLVVLGAAPDSPVVGVTAAAAGSTQVSVVGTPFPTDPTQYKFMAVSDCLKSSVFVPTDISANAITHAQVGGGLLRNASSSLPIGYAPGSQIVQLQQTAFYVGNYAPGNAAGQTVLMRATLQPPDTTGARPVPSWDVEPLVPGVESMQVLYGIGANGVVSSYVPASAVTDWSSIYAIRMAFLIQGQPGSATAGSAPASSPILDGWFTPPVDTRLRHVYEMTINLRNSLS